MNTIKKFAFAVLLALPVLLSGASVLAVYDIDTIASTTGTILDSIVQAIIGVVVDFFTDNLPLIVVLGVSIGLVFWLIRKARGATHGGG